MVESSQNQQSEPQSQALDTHAPMTLSAATPAGAKSRLGVPEKHAHDNRCSKFTPKGTWQASLNLDFIKGPRKTFVHRSHRGPLSMQRPFYPEGEVCHVTLLHPPGGVVSGDELHMNVNVRPRASALIVTPGATKHYRSRAAETTSTGVVRQTLTVDGGSLEWLPNESIHFDGSETSVNTHIDLRGDARLIAADVQVFGRHAGSLPFHQGRADVALSVFDQGMPVLMDRLRVTGAADVHKAAGLRSYTVYGTLVATNASDDLIDLVRDTVRLDPEPKPHTHRPHTDKAHTHRPHTDKAGHTGFQPPHFAVTRIDGLLIARYLGHYSEQAMNVLRDVRSVIRPRVIGRSDYTPRIWST